MNTLEIAEEEYLAEDSAPADDAVLAEAWPIPREDLIREFEEYLLDIGVRV